MTSFEPDFMNLFMVAAAAWFCYAYIPYGYEYLYML